MKLGDWMKLYEDQHIHNFLPLLPIVIRLDGKAFHTFTRNLATPFDTVFLDLMCDTTKWLVGETCACIGYTQSDEITLVLYSSSTQSQVFFNGCREKLNSVVASMATAFFFNRRRDLRIVAHSPCRMRLKRATRCVGAKKMQCAIIGDLHELLQMKGINWNTLPDRLKRGSYFQRREVFREFRADELAKLPPKHEARLNPNLRIKRRDTLALDMPPFGRVINQPDVVFRGAEPQVQKS